MSDPTFASTKDFESYPTVAFYFSVKIDQMSETSFQEVSGISTEVTTEKVVEGGENGYSLELPTGIKHGNLELKRGLAKKDSSIFTWCDSMLSGEFATAFTPKTVEVSLLDATAAPLATWTFTNAYPIKWNVSGFGSTKNEIVLESITLSYASMTRTV